MRVFCKYEYALKKNTSFLPRQSCHLIGLWYYMFKTNMCINAFWRSNGAYEPTLGMIVASVVKFITSSFIYVKILIVRLNFVKKDFTHLRLPLKCWDFKQPNNNAHLRHPLLVNGIHNQCKSVKSYLKHLQIKCKGDSCTISKSKEHLPFHCLG